MKKLLRHTIIGTMIYIGINLIVWFTRPVPFVCFSIYTVTYYMSALLWLWLARRDFKREVSVVCPEIYRDWDQLMWGGYFYPRRKAKRNLKAYPAGNAEKPPQNERHRRCCTWDGHGGDRRRRNFPFYRDDGVRGFDGVERQNRLTPASQRNDPGLAQMLQSLFGSRKGKTNECGKVGI